MNEFNRTEYLKTFPAKKGDARIRSAALVEARENRKFEIELYWKRATYFWAFIAAAFAGYFVAAKAPADVTTSFIIACLGLIFSLAWYCVNRGSKYWQQNWEMHVDLLEDEIAGPIYKTVVQPRKYRFRDLVDAYPFSVSKINQLLSLFVIFVWLVLMAKTMAAAFVIPIPIPHPAIFIMLGATLVAAIFLGKWGHTENSDTDVTISSFFQRRRTYK